MTTVLFVHGTGVRRPSYTATFAALGDAFQRYDIPCDLAPCIWGDELGASLPMLSLPDEIVQSRDTEEWSREQDLARWELLYGDPLFELRLLKQRPLATKPIPPNASRPDRLLWQRILEYEPSQALTSLLRRSSLETLWVGGRDKVIVDDPTGKVLNSSPGDIGEPGQAIARALVASMLKIAIEENRPLPDARQRDEIVDVLVQEWGAGVAGVGTFLMQFFTGTVARVSTPLIRRNRSQLSIAAAPAAGDVLLYQARGAEIRDYIRRCAEDLQTDVVLMAHSLGGIACVDLLALESVHCVTGLITVGSQAPLLQEIGALCGVEPKEKVLPAHFPKWLNVYDPNDFLSYVAGRVFDSDKVQDLRIESGQPFPYAHSAYWGNPDTWNGIRQFLQ